MKTILKNILRVSLILVGFNTTLSATRLLQRSTITRTPVNAAALPEEQKIQSLETKRTEYKKLMNETSTTTYDFYQESLGLGRSEEVLENHNLSRDAQMTQYDNLTKVFAQIKNHCTALANKETDANAKKTLEDDLIDRSKKLLNAIAFNQTEWKTLQENLKIYTYCTQKDADVETRMESKIEESEDFSIAAGLDVTDETLNDNFIKKLRAQVDVWLKIEAMLRTPNLTTEQINEITKSITDAALKAKIAQKVIDEEKAPNVLDTPTKLREYHQKRQTAHTMLLESSLERKIKLFAQYKTIGFAEEMQSRKIKSMAYKVGIPGAALAAIGLFIFAGEKGCLPSTEKFTTPFETTASKKAYEKLTKEEEKKAYEHKYEEKTILEMYQAGRDYITGFFAPKK